MKASPIECGANNCPRTQGQAARPSCLYHKTHSQPCQSCRVPFTMDVEHISANGQKLQHWRSAACMSHHTALPRSKRCCSTGQYELHMIQAQKLRHELKRGATAYHTHSNNIHPHRTTPQLAAMQCAEIERTSSSTPPAVAAAETSLQRPQYCHCSCPLCGCRQEAQAPGSCCPPATVTRCCCHTHQH